MSAARLLTPRGPAGIAVVELAGATGRARLASFGVLPPELGAVRLARLVHDGRALDEALVVAREPDVFELHLHGSPPLVDEVLALCAADAGAAVARSLEGRARELLAHAPSEAGARVLLDQLDGALRRALEQVLEHADRAAARALAARGRRARWLLEPARVVLVGPVNAGKSTLFNALLGERRAVVHGREGTTRDALQARAFLGPWPVDLVDTAGARPLDGVDAVARVERAGQRTAAALAAGADLVLRLWPCDGAPAAGGVGELLPSCLDRPRRPGAGRPPVGGISALTDPEGARREVGARFAAALELDPGDAWAAGRAVPFLREQVAALESLAAGAPEAGALVAELLDRRDST